MSEKRKSLLKLLLHLVPVGLFLLALLVDVVAGFAPGGFWDKIVALFLYPFMFLSPICGFCAIVWDIWDMIKTKKILKNALWALLAFLTLLLGVFFLILHEAFS